MGNIACKRCDCYETVKNGFMQEKQRYRCKRCGYNFTLTAPRGKPPGVKALAILLYGFAGVTMAKIAKLVGVSEVAVYKWIQGAGQSIQRADEEDVEVMMFDEMWCSVNGKKGKFAAGKPMALYKGKSLPGVWVVVVTEALKNS